MMVRGRRRFTIVGLALALVALAVGIGQWVTTSNLWAWAEVTLVIVSVGFVVAGVAMVVYTFWPKPNAPPARPRFEVKAVTRKPRDFARLVCLEITNRGKTATFSADMRIRRYAIGPIPLGWGYDAANEMQIEGGRTGVINIGWMESGPDMKWTFLPLKPGLNPDESYRPHNPQVFERELQAVEVEIFDQEEIVQTISAEIGYGGLADAVVNWRLT